MGGKVGGGGPRDMGTRPMTQQMPPQARGPVAGKKFSGIPMGSRMQGVAQTDEMRAAQPTRPQPTGWQNPYSPGAREEGDYTAGGFRAETWGDNPKLKAIMMELRKPQHLRDSSMWGAPKAEQPQRPLISHWAKQLPQMPQAQQDQQAQPATTAQMYPWLRGGV